MLRLRNFLIASKVWDKAQEDELLRGCNEQVQAAAQAYLDTSVPPASQMFDHLYATLPPVYAAQRAAVIGSPPAHGPDRTR
jgi:pyruvate dehydrogenase E1 component alpha subunit